MCFDEPKVVQSPGCDHGHDEESRNGRDMKIDILEAYIWISEVFRVKSGFYRSIEGLPEPLGGLMGHSGPLWRRGEAARAGPRAPPTSPNRTRRGGRRPPFLSPSLSFPLLSYSNMEGGSPTPGGSRTPHGARLGWPAPFPSSTPLYTGRGEPLGDTTIDH